jgi:hypothetical protein
MSDHSPPPPPTREEDGIDGTVLEFGMSGERALCWRCGLRENIWGGGEGGVVQEKGPKPRILAKGSGMRILEKPKS